MGTKTWRKLSAILVSIFFIAIIIFLLSPRPRCVSFYNNKELNELKIMAKENDKNATNILMGYYSLKSPSDRKSIWLLRCQTYHANKDKINYNNSYMNDTEKLQKECPQNPIDLIEDDNSIGESLQFLYCRIFSSRPEYEGK